MSSGTHVNDTAALEAIDFFGAIASAIRFGELPLHLAVLLESDASARLWKFQNFEVGGAGMTLVLMPWRAGEVVMRVIERIEQTEPRATDAVLLLRQLWDGTMNVMQDRQLFLLEEELEIFAPMGPRWKSLRNAIKLLRVLHDPAGAQNYTSLNLMPIGSGLTGGDVVARSLAWDTLHLAEDAGVPHSEVMSIMRDFGPPSVQEALEAAEYNAQHKT